MDTSRLKKFAQYARRSLIEQVQSKFKLVLADESTARREYPQAIKDLQEKKQLLGEEQLIEQVAYTWFNRFCALRFMDVNQYNRIMVLSPISGQFQPEILAEAKAGHLDETVFNDKARKKIQGLLSGSVPSRDGQAEAYRLIIVAVCNNYYRLMPYLFERIEDYTELLMPDDLLSGNSILAYTREAMTPENCESVESIGWLYQFYISEKKDQVFADLKKNKKITPENIPAATQLFTPHWIVKYLVENSLGRLWMLNNPSSKVIEQMEYYIKPALSANGEKLEEKDFLKINNPEELKICDPACGSGHMLTYAYDLLYAIYLDANYDPVDIPELILTKNLYGIEIDERAVELAAFALSMKALKGNPNDDSNNRRRFFRNPIKPNICRLEKVKIDEDALDEYIDFIGQDLFTQDLRVTLTEFEEADNFGSLIQPTLKKVDDVLEVLETKNVSGQLFLSDTHNSVLKVLKQVDYLSQKYYVVVANPPYLGAKGMNSRLVAWTKEFYPDSKPDLFSMFIERNLSLVKNNGIIGMITMQSWMYLSSFEKLRIKLLQNSTLKTMAHLGARGFDSIGGEIVATTAFTSEKSLDREYKGAFFRLVDGRSEEEKRNLFLEELKIKGDHSYTATTIDFEKIPSFPICYDMPNEVIDEYSKQELVGKYVDAKSGQNTGDNNRFVRQWYEVSIGVIGFSAEKLEDTNVNNPKWYPYNKGGAFRKWYGNFENVVNWSNDGAEIKEYAVQRNNGDHWSRYIQNLPYMLKEGITWTFISSSYFGARYTPKGHIFDYAGCSAFPKDGDYRKYLGYFCSGVAQYILGFLNPSLNLQPGNVSTLPEPHLSDKGRAKVHLLVDKLIGISKESWNSLETSWEFEVHSLLSLKGDKLRCVYQLFKEASKIKVEEALKLENENKKLFIEAFSLESKLPAEVSLPEITLECNPVYKYGNKKTTDELEISYLRDTIVGFVSYSVGCMFGRYSLDKEGLILANQGDSLENYLRQVPSPTFMPDDDNVIPIINFDGDWFEDDITERFKTFLKATFGEENFAENLTFIEEAIGKDIKKFFVKDFYTDHWKRYKKRPIYWMFSSPKGSFNALIYMHRYQPDTASIVLNDYLREFRTKLEARKESYEQVEISASASQKDKTQAIKAITKINKVLEEVNDYEHNVLYPLAGEKIEIDLDDGVKHNYPLFGKALKKITGLS